MVQSHKKVGSDLCNIKKVKQFATLHYALIFFQQLPDLQVTYYY